jgi:hypothetical protein
MSFFYLDLDGYGGSADCRSIDGPQIYDLLLVFSVFS